MDGANRHNALKAVPIATEEQLEFAVFCIENIAEATGKPSDDVYRTLSGESGILNGYIVPCCDVLHSQGREYIVEDILGVMQERGAL